MQVWNVLHVARWKCKMQKNPPKSRNLRTIVQLCRAISSQLRHVSTIGKKNLLSSNTSSTRPDNMMNFSPQAAEIPLVVSGTPANFNRFRVLAALLHGSQVLGISHTLRRWTEGATYIRQGSHHIEHWPTFLVMNGKHNMQPRSNSQSAVYKAALCFRLVLYHLGITLKQHNFNRNSALHNDMFSLLCCQQSSRAISKFLTWRQHSTLFRGHDRLVTTAGGMLLPIVPWCLVTRELVNGALLIIIIIVTWLKTVAPLRVLWQPLWTTTLIKGFQHHHELDPLIHPGTSRSTRATTTARIRSSAFLHDNRQS